MPLRFGEFVLDPESHELLRRGSPLHVSPKAFRLLEVLVSRRPAVVTKQQLLDEVWEGQIVEEENVKNLVAELRRALDSSAEHPLIRTVHRLGYAFTGDAVEIDRVATTGWSLVGRNGTYAISGMTLIGRSAECQIRLQSESVSRVHARVTFDGPQPTIEDLGSKNGTLVDGQRIDGPTRLANGNIIRVGSILLTFVRDELLSTRSIPPWET
jgi:DNA-binding winged helix-turn-helix (wHTH) protein